MKYIKFLLVGVLFGITLSKAEVISWFRIYEMFKLLKPIAQVCQLDYASEFPMKCTADVTTPPAKLIFWLAPRIESEN